MMCHSTVAWVRSRTAWLIVEGSGIDGNSRVEIYVLFKTRAGVLYQI
jgi:hypothetical protein